MSQENETVYTSGDYKTYKVVYQRGLGMAWTVYFKDTIIETFPVKKYTLKQVVRWIENKQKGS